MVDDKNENDRRTRSELESIDDNQPWEACCQRMYTEDIWTPEHFKTNVMNWFLTPQDEQLLCTCQHFSDPSFDNICSTETSSTYYGDSSSDSSSEINQCSADKPPHLSKMCCSNTLSFKLPKQCGVDINNDTMQTCNDRKLKNKVNMSSFCKSYTVNEDEKKRAKMVDGLPNTTECASENNCCPMVKDSEIKDLNLQLACMEETCCRKIDYKNNISKTDKECEKNKRPHNCNKKLVRCKTNEARLAFSKRESGVHIFHPCGADKLLNSCTTQAKKGSVISVKSEISSWMEPCDYRCSDSNKTPVMASGSSSLLSECRLSSEKEESDHRLDYHPDPTLCQKCAADRVPIQEVHKHVIHFQDPRISELDKYCHYKDWGRIYNIRTQVPDEEPIFQIDEDLLLIMRYKDELPRPRRQNHLPTEADINIFIDPKSFEERQVSLNNEYKRENGLNIKIHQPRHYACEVSEVPGHKPAQLIL